MSNPGTSERQLIAYQAHRLARTALEDAIAYAMQRKVLGQMLIDAPVLRNQFAHAARLLESQQAWHELIAWQIDHMSKPDGTRASLCF